MYGSKPDLWEDNLTGSARLRCITNYLTRMRLTNAEGALEFSLKILWMHQCRMVIYLGLNFRAKPHKLIRLFWSLGCARGPNY